MKKIKEFCHNHRKGIRIAIIITSCYILGYRKGIKHAVTKAIKDIPNGYEIHF